MQDKDSKFIEALARGLDVLRAFKSGDRYLGNLELSERTGIPRSSISRITHTLTKTGHLTYIDQLGKYQLDVGVLALGYTFLSNFDVLAVAKPLMQQLANDSGSSVGLATRDRLDLIYIEHLAPASVLSFRNDVGERLSLARTSAGRACLAAIPEDEREYFIEHLKESMKEQSTSWADDIRKAAEEFRQHGYCQSMGEWKSDTNAVAVPLTLNGKVYAINVGGPAYRISPEFLCNEVVPRLKAITEQIASVSQLHK